MTLLLYEEILIANLKQEIPKQMRMYMTQEQAYENLKAISGQDFGYNSPAWEQWFKEWYRQNRESIILGYVDPVTVKGLEPLLRCLKEEYPKKQKGYLTKEQAYYALKKRTGQDFGSDVTAWEKWIKEHFRHG